MRELTAQDIADAGLWDPQNFSDLDFAGFSAENYEDDFRSIVAISAMSAAILGIVANTFVLILSLGHVEGDFRHYVANLAIVDIICGVLFAFMGFVNVEKNGRMFSIQLLTFCALAFYGSFGVMVCALTPISLSRIMAATLPRTYEKYFAGRRSMLVCLLSDFVPVSILVAMCFAPHEMARWLFFFYAGMTVVAYLIALVSNTLVFRIVANHIRVVQSLHDASRLMETRQIALATLAQALVPMVCQVPAFLILSSSLLQIEPVTNGNIVVVTQLWLAASPLFDAIITIGVIKQYRRVTMRCCAVICRQEKTPKKRGGKIVYNGENEIFETKV